MGGTLLSERVGLIGGLFGGYRIAESVRRLAPLLSTSKVCHPVGELIEVARQPPGNNLKTVRVVR